jgi:hypothetical protein
MALTTKNNKLKNVFQQFHQQKCVKSLPKEESNNSMKTKDARTLEH